MSLFGMTRFNGRWATRESVVAANSPARLLVGPSSGGIYAGFYAIGSSPAVGNANVGLMLWASNIVQLSSVVQVAWQSGALNSASDAVIVRETVNRLGIRQGTGSTAAGDLLCRDVYFQQAPSTFALTATLLNGPRIGNPFAWVEVAVAGSTGRIPVW